MKDKIAICSKCKHRDKYNLLGWFGDITEWRCKVTFWEGDSSVTDGSLNGKQTSPCYMVNRNQSCRKFEPLNDS
jgi:hypothetical protein